MLDIDSFIDRVIAHLEVDIQAPVNPYADLYGELGLDSFNAFQLIVIVEALAESMVPPMDLPELYTMSDAYSYYSDLVEAGQS